MAAAEANPGKRGETEAGKGKAKERQRYVPARPGSHVLTQHDLRIGFDLVGLPNQGGLGVLEDKQEFVDDDGPLET